MYRVGVIGLGSIAEGYGSPEGKASYCHVGGILHSDTVELAAVADLSEDRLKNFRTKWGEAFPDTKYYHSADEMMDAEKLDIIAVCVRGPAHHAVTMKVIEAGPKSIFLEKPPSCSLAEMDDMVAAAKKAGIPITVSYSRHWAPHVKRMEELVKDGLIGDVKMVLGYCGGSFLSFASHTTDMICQFANYRPKAVTATCEPGKDTQPGYEPEPGVVGMLIEFDGGLTGIQMGDGGEHGGMTCDIVGTEGRARVGMYIPPFASNKDGEIDLTKHDMPARDAASVFTTAYDQIARYLDGTGPLPDCTDSEFIAVHELGFGGIESALTGRRITLPNTSRSRRIFANG